MVMESPPSPQCVGREFVRQYYTLLNQAPSHLHRFYNNNSSFVHGGLDNTPNRESNLVVGQKQIHQKIQQLNFRDCHAKISQVDSQATLGNGIVVQVTGELSNSGQPMRRFTQTFVLAAQSPKKYYVHNDIFRYQDMLGDDELEHESSRSDGDDEVHDQLDQGHSDSIPPQPQQLPQQIGYYNNTCTLATQTNIAPAQTVTPVAPQTVQATTNAVLQAPPQLPLINGTAHTDEVLQTQIVAQQLATVAPATPITPSVAAPHLISQQVPASNASIQTQQPASPTAQPVAALVNVVPQPQQQPQVPLQPPAALNTNPQIPPQVQITNVPQQPTETIPLEPEPVTPKQIEEIEAVEEETVESPIKQEEDLQPEPVTANEPKTYATSVKSGASTSAVHTSASKPPATATSPPPTMRPLEQRETAPSTTSNISGGFGMAQGGRGAGGTRRGGPNIRGMSRNDRPGPTTRAPYNNEENGLTGSNAVDGDRRRTSSTQYSDSHQLFLGNIPSYVTDEDLKKFFTKFGNVIDVRIHTKHNNKNMSGGRVPNYGFIIFESPDSANSVLKEKPIFLPGQNGDHKLNVEEKKTRVRHPMDGSRISEGGNSMAGGRNGGQGNNIGNGVGTGNANGNGNNGNRGGNNGQSGSGGNGGSIMMRGGGTGGGMPRGGARGGFGGGRGEGRGGGNMSRGTGYRRN